VHAIDTSEAVIDAWTTGIEAMGTLASWVGRAMITSCTLNDGTLSYRADQAIRTYDALRPDLATAIDSLLAGSLAHGFINDSDAFEAATSFLVNVLNRLRQLCTHEDHYDVAAKLTIDTGEWAADKWLPSVTVMDPQVGTTPCPPQ
jgi:hypothetical protein